MIQQASQAQGKQEVPKSMPPHGNHVNDGSGHAKIDGDKKLQPIMPRPLQANISSGPLIQNGQVAVIDEMPKAFLIGVPESAVGFGVIWYNRPLWKQN